MQTEQISSGKAAAATQRHYATKAFRDWAQTRLGRPVESLTDEEKVAVLAYLISEAEKAQAKVEEADRFRPSYAPPGRLTKSQGDARITLRGAEETLEGARIVLGK